MVRQEVPNNTPEQVQAYIAAALELTEIVAPPVELREAVFTAAVNLIASKQILMQQPQALDLSPLRSKGRMS